VADLAEADITQRCQERILRGLWYRGIEDRRNNIADPHYDTLQWALHPPNSDVQWDDLGCWLRSGSGTYWISGKAGSGKSTLMKWLYLNQGTQKMLETWLPGRRLVMANFFIWGLGSPEQNTQEGLCRGLLYNILDSDPSLISQVLPTMWRDALNTNETNLKLPSLPEIGEAFSTLKSVTMKHKFCFFIDGLDEHAGNLLHGTAFINSLVSSGSIKIVVSSRPMPVCVQNFCGSPKLQLHDLTKDDIRAYVDDTIGSHPHIQDLMTMDAQTVQKILRELVDKASGVFLWVVLACRSLLEGFAAFDYPEELRRRVYELPPELEDLFQHMLGKIEPRYQVQAARLLKICHQRRLYRGIEQNIPVEPLVYESIFTLGLALVEECGLDIRSNVNFRQLSIGDRRTKCEVLEAHLRSRCCGLLEIRRPKGVRRVCFCNDSGRRSISSHIPAHDDLVDSTVEFMHHSVFEFLSNPDIWKLQCLQTAGIGFDAYASLSHMTLQLAYTCAPDKLMRRDTHDFTAEALLLAKYADDSSSETTAWVPDSILQMIGGFSKTLSNISNFSNRYPFFAEINRLASETQYAEPILAVESGMRNMIKQLHASGMINPIQKPLLLWHAINRRCLETFVSAPVDISPDTIACLLSIGCDPNMAFMTSSGTLTTPWISWLQYLKTHAIEHPFPRSQISQSSSSMLGAT
jgi:hypothetical protein